MKLSFPPSVVDVRDNAEIGDTINVPVKITVMTISTNTSLGPDGELVEERYATGIIELPDITE